MKPKRKLDARTLGEVADDAERLRSHGYVQDGNWDLAQICSHCGGDLSVLTPASRTEPTVEEIRMQAQLEPTIAADAMPYDLPIFPGTEPKPDADDATIDAFVAGLRRLDREQSPYMNFGPFGPLPLDKFKAFIRIHCVHHLQMLRPK
jgi:hypothetical protein